MKKILGQLMILATVPILSSCGSSANKTSILTEGEKIPVKIAPVQSHENESSITATGLVTTENDAKYSFKIGGVIDRIYVNEGQFFKKGQLLASLKITEIQAQLSQANLGYEKAKRDYTRTLNLYHDSVATLEQVQNAKTSLDIAQKNIDATSFNKKYAYIYANSDGFVTKKIANEGEVISGGVPVLAINETTGTNDWDLKLGVTD